MTVTTKPDVSDDDTPLKAEILSGPGVAEPPRTPRQKQDLVLGNLGKAHQLLQACRDAPEAKRIADMARAAEVYAQRQKLSQEIVAHAHAIKVDAKTLMGRFLKESPKAKGSRGQLKGRVSSGESIVDPPKDSVPTLAEIGIGPQESVEAQTLAELADTEPALHADVRAGKTTVPKAKRAARRKTSEAARDPATAPDTSKKDALAEGLAGLLDDWAHDEGLRAGLNQLEADDGEIAPLAVEGLVEALDVLIGVLQRARTRVKAQGERGVG